MKRSILAATATCRTTDEDAKRVLRALKEAAHGRASTNDPDFECFWTLSQSLHDGIVRTDAAMGNFFQRSDNSFRVFIDSSAGPRSG